MTQNLDAMLGINSPSLEWELEAERIKLEQRPFQDFKFLTMWELQSQIATIAFIVMVAVLPILAVLGVMLIWSIIATLVYYRARQNGLPDLMETRWERPPTCSKEMGRWMKLTGWALMKTWSAGIQPFFYSKLFCPFLGPVKCWRMKLVRTAILGVGFTLFGVTTAHHLLRRAGVANESVLRLSLVSPFLNVPYRILLSAIVVNAVMHLAGPMPV